MAAEQTSQIHRWASANRRTQNCGHERHEQEGAEQQRAGESRSTGQAAGLHFALTHNKQ